MFQKVVVVDAKGHLLGRLAAKVAKELLTGQHVVVVRCEELNVTGSLFRNKLKYHDFLRKRVNTNPSRGPFHHKAPSKIFWRSVRGMLPHKTARGAAALQHLRVFEGVPPPYDKVKKFVVPEALRVVRLRPGRNFCRLGELSTQVGWKYAPVVEKLEQKRKTLGKAFHKKQKARVVLRRKAVQTASSNPKLTALNPILQAYGY